MISDDWFRHETWNDQAQAEFERGLGRARGDISQRIRIQGSILSASSRGSDRAVGRNLLERVIDEYPDAFDVVSAWEHLAESFALEGQVDLSIEAYAACLRECQARPTGKSGTSGTPELGLADVLVRRGATGDAERAARLLAAIEADVREDEIIASVVARYWLTCARAAAALSNPAAGAFARNALDVVEHGTPVLRYHQQLAVARMPGDVVAELTRIANAFPDDVVERSSVADAFGVSATPVVETEGERQHQQRVESWQEQIATELAPLYADLRAADIPVDEIWDLDDAPKLRQRALPVLIRHLHHRYPDEVRALLARVLQYADLGQDDWDELLALYRTMDQQTEPKTMSGVANALARSAGKANVPIVLQLLHDPKLGSSRTAFVGVLGRLRVPDRWQIIERLAHDPQLAARCEQLLAGQRKRNRDPAR